MKHKFRIRNIGLKSDEIQLRNFSLLFGVFFGILSFYFFLLNENKFLIFFLLSIIIIGLGYIYPKIFKPIYTLWMFIPVFMSFFLTPLILFLLYFLLFIPIGLIYKILKISFLDKRIDTEKKSYWSVIEIDNNTESIENQF